ncbi:hypothetical protein Tco_1075413 [Tanacetum coccineum]
MKRIVTSYTYEGTVDQTEGRRATPTTPTTTPTMFGDDETIAQVLLNMSQAKAVSREKEKGVELKDVEETERPRTTSTRSLLTLKPLPKIDPKDKGKKKIKKEDKSETESEGIPEAKKKFKQLAMDEEMARKLQEDWEIEEERKRLAEEREQFTVEERAKFLHDTIAAQRRFLAEQRAIAIRNKPPTRTQLRNQMMTYLKHDERRIKEMNEGVKDTDQKRLKEEDTTKVPAKVEVTEQGTKKRKGGHIKMIARKKPRKQSDVDSDDEHRKCLKIVTFEAYSEITLEGIELILWGDLKIMMDSSTEENDQSDFWSNQQDWKISEEEISSFKDYMQRCLIWNWQLKEKDWFPLDLIRFIKKQIEEE